MESNNDYGIFIIIGVGIAIWLAFKFLGYLFSGRMFQDMRDRNARNRVIQREKQDLKERDLDLKERRLRIRELEISIREHERTHGKYKDLELDKLKESLRQLKNLS